MITLDDKLMKWRVIPLEINGPYRNTAFDEVMINSAAREGRPILRFYRWYPFGISLGYAQTIKDFNLRACALENYQIVRRLSGGKATIHRSDTDLCYSLAIPTKKAVRDVIGLYEEYCGKIANGLSEMGLKDVSVNKNDIFTENKKISGNASRNTANVYMQHGFIFYKKPDVDSMLKLINKLAIGEWKNLRGEEEITSISENIQIDQEQICNILTNHITAGKYELSDWDPEEYREVQELANNKYKKSEWMNKGTEHKGLCYIIWD